MKISFNFLLSAIAAILLVSCSSGSNVAGEYHLDKDAMRKAAEADIAKMPADQQAMGKMMLTMIEAMDITITLEDGGVAKFVAKVPNMKDGGTEEKVEAGTWKQEGDKITISSEKEPNIECSLEGKTLDCKNKGQSLKLIKS